MTIVEEPKSWKYKRWAIMAVKGTTLYIITSVAWDYKDSLLSLLA